MVLMTTESAPTRVVGYCRTSKDLQEVSIEVQRQTIETAAESRGWELVAVLEEHASGRSTDGRPALDAAMSLVRAHGADAVAVAKLDRLTRSTVDFGRIIEQVPVVALDMDLDMTTPVGEMVANVLMAFAQFERRLISERTKAALAAKRAQGQQVGWASAPPDVVARICREHAAGKSLRRIGLDLDADGVPTAQGGARWYPATVRAVLRRATGGISVPTGAPLSCSGVSE